MRAQSDIEDLIARTAIKDQAAFSELYDATSAKLFGVCLVVLKNRAEAEETLQEVFIRIWHKADKYAVTGHSPMTWLITVARNLSIDKLRARKARDTELGDAVDIADIRPGPEAAAIASSDARRIASCLNELDPDRSGAVKSAYLNGDSYQTLAERYSVPLNTMRTWLRRSLSALRECMSR